MGLLKTAVRASVAARVVGNVQRKQQTRWAAEDAQTAVTAAAVPPAAPVAPPVPAPTAPADMTAMIEQLTQLGQLRDAGVLSEAEFEAQKARLLGAQ